MDSALDGRHRHVLQFPISRRQRTAYQIITTRIVYKKGFKRGGWSALLFCGPIGMHVILRPDWSAKFILRRDWSAKFILRRDWSAKFILRWPDWSAKFILRRDWSTKFILRRDWSAKFILQPDWSTCYFALQAPTTLLEAKK
jgi:hypothetical protein